MTKNMSSSRFENLSLLEINKMILLLVVYVVHFDQLKKYDKF